LWKNFVYKKKTSKKKTRKKMNRPVDYVNIEPGKWQNYGFYTYDITAKRSHDAFFDEYRTSVAATEFVKARGNFTKKEFAESLYNTLILSNYALKNNSQMSLEDATNTIVAKRINHEKMKAQANILEYIAVGDWRTKTLEPGDQIYLMSFGESRELPLIWFVVSFNVAHDYMRLHAWARSITSSYIYRVFRQQEPPRNAGIYALSWLFWILKKRKMFVHTLIPTISILKKMEPKRFLKLLKHTDDPRAAGEPQEMEITDEMMNAFKKEDVYDQDDDDDEDAPLGACIMCGKLNAGFYMAHLGREIRFCGKGCV